MKKRKSDFFLKTLREVGEIGVIKRIERSVKRRNRKMIADFGEDSAIFKVGKRFVAVSTDMGVAGTHFVSSNAEKIGSKIAVAANTDLLAKGALPRLMWLDIALPAKTPVFFVEKLYKGVDRQLSLLGAFLVGGDTNNAGEFCYSATVFGEVQFKPILRRNAKAGDVLVLSGEVGSASAGLFCVLNKKKCPKKFFDAQNTPELNLNFCKKVMKYANAGVDVSDGMAKELNDVAKQSGKKLVVDWDKIPFDKRLVSLCKENGWSLEDLLFHRGEDYQVIYSVPASKAGFVEQAGGVVFGRVLIAKKKSGVGLF
ncbi:MAG: thiamine-phosphate kinase, partial [Candidatus Micrarchaeia archaeon]